ncbi:hypothetical protein CGLO_06297 [Colletotrichum gloeosporioides Cg-14]|uniref:Uncharacterized protein n=1 Tax=Colletotrichum gloeosporioides (strain Cg-14) TaxID=1237896 RepID=T0LZH1_COLGC|nr:hypothetical protein CGLO_06297 [Colletotrichum gloeosporioides Cg-14]
MVPKFSTVCKRKDDVNMFITIT